MLCLNDGAPPELGVRWTPAQGWRFWCRLALWFAVAIAVLLALFVGVWILLERELPVMRTDPAYLLPRLFHACVEAPLVEEIIYRALLVWAVLPTLGSRGTILASGVVFALVHVLRGIPSPENQVAGFLLAWAFLRSGTILVPLALHSAGNLFAVAGQVAAWHWLPLP